MQKSKSLNAIEEKLQTIDAGSYRYKVLSCARDFKNSWIDLGQFLIAVYKDKMYKDWGYLTFEAYCSKEIGIKQPTAMKLLKSYSFLEKEEPAFLNRENLEERQPARIPSYESVNALRLAKESEKLSQRQYEDLREDVFDDVKEDAEVKKKIRYVLKSSQPAVSGTEDKSVKRLHIAKRLLTQLQNARLEFEAYEMNRKVMVPMAELIDVLEDFTKA